MLREGVKLPAAALYLVNVQFDDEIATATSLTNTYRSQDMAIADGAGVDPNLGQPQPQLLSGQGGSLSPRQGDTGHQASHEGGCELHRRNRPVTGTPPTVGSAPRSLPDAVVPATAEQMAWATASTP